MDVNEWNATDLIWSKMNEVEAVFCWRLEMMTMKKKKEKLISGDR
jgi:hypothetical protein